MKNYSRILFAPALTFAFALAPVAALAADAVVSGTISGKVLAGGSKRVTILDTQGQVEWEYPAALTHDAWMLPSGNVLFADGASVTEVSPDKKVVFQYKAKDQAGGGSYACQRLENGNTLIGENSTGKVLEVDGSGKTVFELQTQPSKPGDHHNMRMARKLKNGNYLVCHSGAHMVKEYTPKGEVVLEIKVDSVAFAAVRTDKNTTIIASLNQIGEYDSTGKKVWHFANTDIPGVTITNMTGIHVLPNGDIATGCYAAYKNGKGTGLLEITRQKKLVWSYSNPKGDGTMMAIQVLDKEGKPLPEPALR